MAAGDEGHDQLLVLALNVTTGAVAGELAQHRPRDQARSTGIVVIEQSAHQLARGKQAGNRLAVGALDFAAGGDLQPTEGEGESAGYGIGFERRLVDREGPVALRNGKPTRAAAVLDGGIER